MSFFAMVEEEIRGLRIDAVSVADFRVSLAESTRSAVGVESNRVGSPYRPLSVSEAAGGSFLIHWSDGTISRGALSRAPRDALRETLAAAFEGRYRDEEEENFPGPAEVPETPLSSEDVAAVAEGREPGFLPDVIERLARISEAAGARILDASAQASSSRRVVISSRGFRGESASTGFSFSVAFDSLVWDGHARRRLIDPAEIEALAEQTATDYSTLRGEPVPPPRGKTEVLLHPRVAESFLDTFLFSNLSGGAVANGRSRFGADDFREGKRVVREDLSITARPSIPLGNGSFRFSDEGVPARDFDLVRDGRLVTPTLSLKYARRLGMEPAAAPGAIEGFELSLDGRVSRDDALGSGGRRVLVHSVMGLHTQDSARAEYSLLAPQGVHYEDGECRGRVSTTLNGSFFDDLGSPGLRFVDFPGFACPGLLVVAELS